MNIQNRFQGSIFLVMGAALMIASSCTAIAQTLTNNGTIMYVAPKAVVQVNGNAEVRAAGIVTAEDSSSIRVTGNLQVSNGSVNMNKRSTVLVNGNVETGGVYVVSPRAW